MNERHILSPAVHLATGRRTGLAHLRHRASMCHQAAKGWALSLWISLGSSAGLQGPQVHRRPPDNLCRKS